MTEFTWCRRSSAAGNCSGNSLAVCQAVSSPARVLCRPPKDPMAPTTLLVILGDDDQQVGEHAPSAPEALRTQRRTLLLPPEVVEDLVRGQVETGGSGGVRGCGWPVPDHAAHYPPTEATGVIPLTILPPTCPRKGAGERALLWAHQDSNLGAAYPLPAHLHRQRRRPPVWADTKARASRDLRIAYENYCLQQGISRHEQLSSTAFGRRMARRYAKDRDAQGVHYLGVTLRGRPLMRTAHAGFRPKTRHFAKTPYLSPTSREVCSRSLHKPDIPTRGGCL